MADPDAFPATDGLVAGSMVPDEDPPREIIDDRSAVLSVQGSAARGWRGWTP
ncbi:hypothetical protein [Rarobacter incanus]|uniref:hypothetical protein n=1 Tax=Rarobacter incanus TaxID=153494 RepID=UPI0014768F0D|nr:hypothetical protein [Rarobacter incanus]